MTAFSHLLTHQADGVFTITMNRPDALNALNEELAMELNTALRIAQREADVRCVVLTGRGRGFCSGQDLKELAGPGGGQPPHTDFANLLRQRYNPLIVRMRTMEKPVVAAINGVAAGAGVSLALAADLKLCTRQATFILAFANIGLVPDAGATLTLLQHVGYARAAEMCLLAEPISAETALQYGLVNRIVDENELESATRALATRLARMPTRSLALAKRALNQGWNATLDEQLALETYLQQTAGESADYREGLRAFLEKRPPAFRGV